MKLNGVDLNKLRLFGAVIEQRGYRGASEAVGLTRSAISQGITSLELQLGKTLFHRVGTKLLPTEAALAFYEEVARHYGGIESAVERLQSGRVSESGILRVGAYLEFTKGKLMPAIESFLVANPRAQIQFHFDSPTRLRGLLETGKIDLALSIYAHPKREIESRELYEEELCLIGHRDVVSRHATAAELGALEVIDYFPSHLLFKRWWGVHFRKAAPQVSPRVFAATAEMVLALVERKLGIGVVPRYILAGASDRLHVVEPTPKKLLDHLWLSRKRVRSGHPLEEAFLRAVEKGLEKGLEKGSR